MTCIKIWDATGAYHQKFNNSVTFAALTVKFYTLQLPSAPLFPCAFSSAADKRPVRTDISIAQKTCVFRPVDISVAAAKRSKLIYQSVYSLLGILAGNPFRKSRKKAAAPGAVQRLVYNIKVSQFFLAA
jgi:hypothetical protein